MLLLLFDSVVPLTPHHFFHPAYSDFKMLAISANLRRQPLAIHARFLALLFVVCWGFPPGKVDASIISPPVSATSSETLSDENLSEDFRSSQSIVKSLMGSFSRTDELFGDWVSLDKIKNQTGATKVDQSVKTTRQTVQSAPPAPQQFCNRFKKRFGSIWSLPRRPTEVVAVPHQQPIPMVLVDSPMGWRRTSFVKFQSRPGSIGFGRGI